MISCVLISSSVLASLLIAFWFIKLTTDRVQRCTFFLTYKKKIRVVSLLEVPFPLGESVAQCPSGPVVLDCVGKKEFPLELVGPPLQGAHQNITVESVSVGWRDTSVELVNTHTQKQNGAVSILSS